MGEAFNPYHKWLGIPPEEQPPSHYRLLGIRPFEADADVIESAADQRMAHLRTHQAGKYSDLSQKLLNEVASAKVCLLNPKKRADYDEALRRRTASDAGRPAPAEAPSSTDYDLDRLGLSDDASPGISAIGAHVRHGVPVEASTRGTAPHRFKVPLWAWALGASGAAIAATVAIAVLTASNDAPPGPSDAPPPAVPAVAASYGPKGELAVIDLQAKSTGRLSVPLQGSTSACDLAVVPRGDQKLCGVKFRIADAALLLGSSEFGENPRRIDGINVNEHVARLYILQGAAFAKGIADGQGLGEYKVHYEDGTDASVPIVYGEDVREWYDVDQSKAVTRGKLAWAAAGPAGAQPAEVTRLYAACWVNPFPTKKVASIDFHSLGGHASPFCVAMTIERAPQPVPDVKKPGVEAVAAEEKPSVEKPKPVVSAEAPDHDKPGVEAVAAEMKPSVEKSTPVISTAAPHIGALRIAGAAVPQLIEPSPGAELPNCLPGSATGSMWRFRWAKVAGATLYHVTIEAPGRSKPVFDVPTVRGTSLQCSTSSVPDAHRLGWQWKVRAMVDGEWTDWSTTQKFDVAALSANAAEPAPAVPAATEPVAAEPKKRVAPDAEAIKKADRLVADIFGDEERDAVTTDKRLALAEKMRDQSDDAKNDDATSWVLLDHAAKLAAKAGNLAVALRTLDRKAARFGVDLTDDEVAMVKAALKARGTPEQKRANVDAAFMLVEKRMAADDFDGAVALDTAFRDFAHSIPDLPVARLFEARTKDIQRRQEEFAVVQQARETLKSKPDDPEANLTAGKYLCLRKNDWEKGLPLLARGSDDGLKEVAQKEQADTATGAARLELADAWYDLAKKDPARDASPLWDRARYWYQQSLEASPKLEGLEQTKAKKRFEELSSRMADSRGAAGSKAGSAKGPDASVPRRAMILAACKSSFEMYLNGVQVGADSSNEVQRFPCELKSGDVLTVRVQGSSSSSYRGTVRISTTQYKGFACIILIEQPTKSASKRKRSPLNVATGMPAWQSYAPSNSMEWYKPEKIQQKGTPIPGEVDPLANQPGVIVAHPTVTSAQLVSQAAGGLPCMSIWGSEGSTCYLTLTINWGNK